MKTILVLASFVILLGFLVFVHTPVAAAIKYFELPSTWDTKIGNTLSERQAVWNNPQPGSSNLMAEINGAAAYFLIDRWGWSSVHCTARNSDPLKTVTWYSGSNHNAALTGGWNVLHIPNSCNPPGEADGHVVIINADDDRYLWETNGARKDANGNWSVARIHRWDRKAGLNSAYGGRGLGVNLSYTGNTEGTTGCAASADTAHGTILKEELNTGVINHALRFLWRPAYDETVDMQSFYPCVTASPISWGKRFMLDPSINVDALNVGKDMKTILKAAQQYGYIFTDITGAGESKFMAETKTDWTGYDFSINVSGGSDNFMFNNSRWIKCIEAYPGECSGAPPPPLPTPTSTPTPTFSKCDQNHDTSINVLDLQSLANVILGKTTCTPSTGSGSADYTCDLNQDNSTNVLDLQYLANVILGKNSCQ